MCHIFCHEVGEATFTSELLEGKDVLEVGSYDVNGTLRHKAMEFNPKSYIGVDISAGPCVDTICDANHLALMFGAESFDIVLSTEMMEHVEDWRNVITNMKTVLKPKGYILITTRSKGFGYHGYPHDYWRYEESDMARIFADFDIIEIRRDPQPGLSVFARKREVWTPVDLSKIELYDIRQHRGE